MSEGVCDLWIVFRHELNSASVRMLEDKLQRCSPQNKLNYRVVLIEDLAIGFVQGQLCVYLDGRRQDNLPKVAYVFLPHTPFLTPHMIHAIRHLELMGVRCVNSSSALSICRNKVQQFQLVASQGVSVPDTVTYAGSSVQGLPNLLAQPHNISFPAILKHAASSGGKRVMLIPNKETIQDITHSLKDDDVYMLQHYVKESHGTHIRALVIGNKVHGVYRATNVSNSRVQSNVSLGGKWATIKGDPEIESLALKVTQTLSLDLAGVDFVEDGKGQKLFLEANACPSLIWSDTFVNDTIDYLTNMM